MPLTFRSHPPYTEIHSQAARKAADRGQPVRRVIQPAVGAVQAPWTARPAKVMARSWTRAANPARGPSAGRKGARLRRVTITDVGTAAGVSTSTVSRVLNGTARVDPELVRRVHDAVAELGYRPNAAAQGLACGEAGAIGVLVPDLANPYFPDVLKSVSAVPVRTHGTVIP
ncbi:LacI family DNA-binding transcriptional regulator [Streptomyces sp. NPDC000188]|uniref:LacI family DNA-binding transcriptional regulator n=1 Tax=Streptomyces sp. NPDC000188 TaxID=3154245 RepID=UPI00332AD04C